MVVGLIIVYGLVFLAIGVGTMIAIQAQREYESVEPVLGEVPENIAVKRRGTTGWRTW